MSLNLRERTILRRLQQGEVLEGIVPDGYRDYRLGGALTDNAMIDQLRARQMIGAAVSRFGYELLEITPVGIAALTAPQGERA